MKRRTTMTLCGGCGFPVGRDRECPLMWTDECLGPDVEGSETVKAWSIPVSPWWRRWRRWR